MAKIFAHLDDDSVMSLRSASRLFSEFAYRPEAEADWRVYRNVFNRTTDQSRRMEILRAVKRQGSLPYIHSLQMFRASLPDLEQCGAFFSRRANGGPWLKRFDLGDEQEHARAEHERLLSAIHGMTQRIRDTGRAYPRQSHMAQVFAFPGTDNALVELASVFGDMIPLSLARITFSVYRQSENPNGIPFEKMR